MNNEFKGLRHYMDIVEGKNQQVDEEGIMNALGQLGGAVAGTAMNGVNAVGNAVGGAYDAAKAGVGKAVDAAGNAIAGAVKPVVQGAQTGYAAATGQPAAAQGANPTKPAAPAAPGAPAKPAAPAKPGAAPAAGKPEAWVKELQTKLNAAGEKLNPDGVMGPATRAAQARHPEITTQPAAAQAVAADINSAEKAPAQGANPSATPVDYSVAPAGAKLPNAAPAAAAPAKAADGGPAPTPEQLKWLGGANPNDPIILGRMRAAVPNAPTLQQHYANNPNVRGLAVKESAYDEVERIVSLVHYK